MQRQANNKVFRRIFAKKVTTVRPRGVRKAISHIQPKPLSMLMSKQFNHYFYNHADVRYSGS